MEELEARKRRKIDQSLRTSQSRPGTAQSTQSLASQSYFSGNVLHSAASQGNVDEVRRILKTSRTLLNSLDADGRSALFYGVHGNQLEVVKFLLSHGGLVNMAAADGSRVLHEAAHRCSKEMVQLLLDHGADATACDLLGRTPLHWATDNALGECVGILARCKQVNINARDADDMTPIMYAAYHQRVHHVKKLLNMHADLEEKDRQGNTAMYWAVHPESTAVLAVLMTVDATFFRNAAGHTVMHRVGDCGSADAVDLISRLRADSVHDIDRAGRTPLFAAAASNNHQVLARLMSRGAKPDCSDLNGETPLSVAIATGSQDCMAILQQEMPAAVLNLTAKAQQATKPRVPASNPMALASSWKGPTSPHRDNCDLSGSTET